MIVVDASVAVKWTVREEGHAHALSVLESAQPLVAPELMLAELASVLRRKARADEISWEQAERALSVVPEAISNFLSVSGFINDAWRLSYELDHSPYDCLYLACALPFGILVSADERFVAKCKHEGYARFVCLPEDIHEFATLNTLNQIPSGTLTSIQRLSEQVRATFGGLQETVGQLGGLELKGTSTERISLAIGSPAYRRLETVLSNLDEPELASLIAVGWFGRFERSPKEMASLLSGAMNMVAEGRHKHTDYFMTQMQYVQKGIEKLRWYSRSGSDAD